MKKNIDINEGKYMHKNEKKMLEIFIVTYNRADYLKKSIESVLQQTYEKFDLIILDNCSTDHTKKVVESFCDNRIQYICHAKNIGSIENINYAISHAQNKYFMVFHDDDVMYPSMIETQLNIMEEDTSLAAISCKADNMDSEGGIVKKSSFSGKLKKYEHGCFFADYISNQSFIMFPSLLYRTEYIHSKGLLLQKDVGPSADVFLCFEIEKNGGYIGVLNSSLMAYRKHEGQESNIYRVEMIVKLFTALKKDRYFEAVLKQNSVGERKYYKWLMHNEICMVAKNFITVQQAKYAKREYENIMCYRKSDYIVYAIVLWDQQYLGVSKLLYRLYKSLKG